MATKERRFDKTQLRAKHQGTRVHRDYAAHYFRWGFAHRFINEKKSVLDIGCGVDQPLPKVLCYRKNTRPRVYVGVDLNKIPKKFGAAWAVIKDQFQFTDDWPYLRHIDLVGEKHYDVVCCFEVIEHMEVDDARELLKGAYTLTKPKAEGGIFLLSTPVYDGVHMPKNHIHEFTVPELQNLLEEEHFVVKHRYGTFSSWPVIRKVITPEERNICDRLLKYYSHEIISTFLAPLYPDHSRNNVWVLERSN